MTLQPEDELLVLCARTTVTPKHIARLQTLVTGDLDWDIVLRQAARHRVIPLVCQNLRQIGAGAVPKRHLMALQLRAMAIAHRNTVLTTELVRLLDRFESERIEVIPLKGPVVALTLYGSLALRPFGDLDLLVHGRDRERACRLLLDEQYQPYIHSQQYGFLESRLQYHRRYDHPTRGISVEIHWDIATRALSLPFANESLWARLESVPLLTRTAAALAPEDLLLMLCIHGAKHDWPDLAFVCDIGQWIMRYQQFDATLLMKRAALLHVERILRLGLMLASQILAMEMPHALCAAVQADPQLPRLAAHYRQQLFARKSRTTLFQRGLASYRSYPVLRTTFLDRLAVHVYYFGAVLTQPSREDRGFLNLPANLSFLYVLVRPLRITIQFIQWLWQETRSSTPWRQPGRAR